jgi:hypothetical protein
MTEPTGNARSIAARKVRELPADVYVAAEENALAPGIAELHIQAAEDVTIILPEGEEIYVAGDGSVRDSQGREMRVV